MASSTPVKGSVGALVLLSVFLAGVSLTVAEVYKVGGSVGWTILGTPNYTAWASTKTFHVGDILLFEYNKQFHNVLQTSKADYTACNAASALATHTTGNDSIAINVTGHLYFICGVPGHCSLGQKVDILVSKSASSAAPSPSAKPSTTPSPAPAPVPAPAPAPGGGSGIPAPPPKPSHAPAARMRLDFALAVLLAVSAFSLLS